MSAVFRNRHFRLFVGVYALALGVLVAGGRPVEEALGALVILGIALPLLALGACWRMPEPAPPQSWRPDDAATMAILVGWIVVFLVVKGPLLDALVPYGSSEALRDTVNAALKLLAFVALPAIFLRRRGFGWRQAGRPVASPGRLVLVLAVLAIACLGVQYLIGRQFRVVLTDEYLQRHVVIGSLLAFAWLTIEAGLVEEFFFRWYLQSRLAAWSGSQVSAVFLGSLVFGLAHAPGIWLRGAGVGEGLGSNPSLATTLAYVVATQGVAGLMFGVLWARTRSFLLVVVLHGLVDAPANAAWFMDKWGL